MVYENIESLCQRKGLTICALEKKAGLSNGTVGKWRTASPRLKNLERVAKVLGVSVNRLLRK